ncbi:hypothetical protein CK503_15660 [Aliifodinibius salipaludis]|uniref:Uncharacterized protein n=1 Tax=Fodinibius salipaludis TaxID=2032627 RepID=A0A2A2G6L0_9BACT|nr:hypothetical protein [Aliifodinibius salipaludis]PAU92644.1 hypothetical protein CK503_15660 [Aliifodinibius salipaludis]
MDLDWNWFYSALAQSAAAIVGVFGAFLISYLMRLQQEFSNLTKQLRNSLNNRDKLHQEINQLNFEWFNENYETTYLNKIANLVYDEELEKSPEELYEPNEFSPFQSKTKSIEKIKRRINTAEQQLQIYLNKKEKQQDSTFGKLVPVQHPSSKLTSTLDKNKDYYQMMNDFKEKAFNKFTSLKFTLREINQLIDDAEKFEGMRKILIVSAVLSLLIFFSCVIYPLSFLPVFGNETITFEELTLSAFWNTLMSLKGLFLSILSIIITFGIGLVIRNVKNFSIHNSFETNLQESASMEKQPIWYQNYHQ